MTHIDNCRPETEAYTSHLAELLINGSLQEQLSLSFAGVKTSADKYSAPNPGLRILDVCSGSGCISLLLHSLLSKSGKFSQLQTTGLDISPEAVALARENLALNVKAGHLPSSAASLPQWREREQDPELKHLLQHTHLVPHDASILEVPQLRCKRLKKYLKSQANQARRSLSPPHTPIHFAVHDIFSSLLHPIRSFDIIISNPPYISPSSFTRETTRSVQKYEPKLALVPPTNALENGPLPLPPTKKLRKRLAQTDEADIFYFQLLRIYTHRASSILLMEVGDAEQAVRVIKLAMLQWHVVQTNRFEIWRDSPALSPQPGEEESVEIEGTMVPVKGAGRMRAVVLLKIKEVGRRKRKEDVGS